MTKSKGPKIGLALGSGAARGLAHIGVIKVLEENNIPIDYIAGSSIGAMVGGLYASGLGIEKIEKLVLDMTNRDMFSLVDPRIGTGLIKGEKIKSFIESNLAVKNFKDCRIPFSATATDIKTGEIVVLESGNMADAIRASISMPLVFQPVERDGKTLVDGGVGMPVPVEIVRKMGADIVIAVNLDKHYVDDDWQSGLLDIANDSTNIMRHYLSLYQSKEADIVINLDLGFNKWHDFVNGQDKILAGEKMMKKEMPYLKKLIHSKKKSKLEKLFDFLKNG
jgi:NTE family protein